MRQLHIPMGKPMGGTRAIHQAFKRQPLERYSSAETIEVV
jgi:hypothetical protein